MPIDTNLILDGISLALREAFPESQIYAEGVKQGLSTPAFILQLADAGQAAQPVGRWQCQSSFDIVYFPKSPLREREECCDTAARLFSVLEVIALPGEPPRKLRGNGMSFRIEDGLLHFLISYSHSLRRENREGAMETLKIQEGGSLK